MVSELRGFRSVTLPSVVLIVSSRSCLLRLTSALDLVFKGDQKHRDHPHCGVPVLAGKGGKGFADLTGQFKVFDGVGDLGQQDTGVLDLQREDAAWPVRAVTDQAVLDAVGGAEVVGSLRSKLQECAAKVVGDRGPSVSSVLGAGEPVKQSDAGAA